MAWNVGLPVVLVGLSDRNIFSDDFSEAMDVFMRRGIREEFCWSIEWIAIDHFSREDVEAVFQSGPKSKEGPGELVSPGSISAAGDESGFQRPVHTFYHAVGFGVVGGRMVTRGTEELVEGCLEEGCEGRTLVGCNVLRDAEAGDTCGEEGGSAGGGRGINHGQGFWPARRAIDDGEEVSVAF